MGNPTLKSDTSSTSSGSSMAKRFLSAIFFGYFSYSTVKEVKIHNLVIAVIFRVLQAGVLFYIIYYDIIRNKSYQTLDPVSSSVTSKVKGLGIATYRGNSSNSSSTYRLFDTADYVVPPSEYNAIFIMTNFVETGPQKQDSCHEDYTSEVFRCNSDADCKRDKVPFSNWHGDPTEKCLYNITGYDGKKYNVCEINGWCPTEIEISGSKENLIKNIENYTIFIKNDVQFKFYKTKLRNILPNVQNSYISSCLHDEKLDRYCPVFKVQNILEEAEPDPAERQKMLEKGGVIQVEIDWECDLDLNIKHCFPKYQFQRFDLRGSTAASGFNFRHSDKFEINGVVYRNLIKAYGLRFIISVTGKAGKFNVIPTFLTIGAGIGLLAIPVLISDCVLLYCTPKRDFYSKIKEYDYKAEPKASDSISIDQNSYKF